jgi:peptidoglycan/xylan/chitin deacetylase (PgdA/CDA1 family)
LLQELLLSADGESPAKPAEEEDQTDAGDDENTREPTPGGAPSNPGAAESTSEAPHDGDQAAQPEAAPPPFSPTAMRCPMLYYHEVPGQAGLAAQLQAFARAGYSPVPMGRLVDALEGRAEPPPGCLVLTFDDGLASQIRNALPVLERFGVSATFFVMPDFRDGVHRYMSLEDIRAMRDAGQEIGSHTLNHASLPALMRSNFGAFQAEIIQSKAILEEALGQKVDLLAYPNGAWDRATAEEVRAAGYRAAASTIAGTWQRPQDAYWLRRVRADTWEPPQKVLSRLSGGGS